MIDPSVPGGQLVSSTAVAPHQDKTVAGDQRGQAIAGLILAALAGATYKQGGFYSTAQWYLGALVVIASAVAVTLPAGGRRWFVELPRGWRMLAAPFALVVWTLLDAGLHGSVGSGARLALLVIAVVLLIADCRLLDRPSVDVLLGGLLVLCAVTALIGWYGVATHHDVLAITMITGLIGIGTAVLLAIADRRAGAVIGRARANLSSSDRLAAWHAVWRQIALHPVAGSGPGLRQLSWQAPDGSLRVFAYAHDEYLQLFAELGLVGVLCVAGCVVSLVVLLHRSRPAHDRSATHRASWALAVAAVLSTAISALFDFTGHFPAITLTAAALVGCAGAARTRHLGPESAVQPGKSFDER